VKAASVTFGVTMAVGAFEPGAGKELEQLGENMHTRLEAEPSPAQIVSRKTQSKLAEIPPHLLNRNFGQACGLPSLYIWRCSRTPRSHQNQVLSVTYADYSSGSTPFG